MRAARALGASHGTAVCAATRLGARRVRLSALSGAVVTSKVWRNRTGAGEFAPGAQPGQVKVQRQSPRIL